MLKPEVIHCWIIKIHNLLHNYKYFVKNSNKSLRPEPNIKYAFGSSQSCFQKLISLKLTVILGTLIKHQFKSFPSKYGTGGN